MKIHFFGTRGSIPAPGLETVIYGGNTTCVEILFENQKSVIIDAGTGIRNYSKIYQPSKDDAIHLFFTHSHWDHLQGLPFFNQIYVPNQKINFYINEVHFEEVKEALIKQMTGKTFPVLFQNLPSRINFIPISGSYSLDSDITIRVFENCHPGGSTSYQFIENSKVITFITDNELSMVKENNLYQKLLDFAAHSDMIIHDGQYLKKEMNLKKGWGHSTLEDVVEFYLDAKPKIGIFTHHDPERTDEEVETMEKWAQDEVEKNKASVCIIAAKENSSLEI